MSLLIVWTSHQQLRYWLCNNERWFLFFHEERFKLPSSFQLIMAYWHQFDGLMQKRRNSIANALELRLFCIKPSIWWHRSGSTFAEVKWLVALLHHAITRTNVGLSSMGFCGTHLTHWGWDKMAAIFRTTFSHVFSWMKMYPFWLRFHWSLFLRVQLTTFQQWYR